jgi:hypothetical protein
MHVSRRLLVISAIAVPLLAGGSAAYASQAGGTPTPSSSYGQHHEESPQCQIITLQGFGTQTGHKNDEGGDQGGQYNTPQGGMNDHGNRGAEVIVVTQQVQFCEQGERTWTTPVPYSLTTVEGVVEGQHHS